MTEVRTENDVFIGIGLGLCIGGCVISSLGLVLQKYSHNVGELELPLHQRWRWWLGFFILCITGGAINAVALIFAPLSLIAPTSGLTVATNSLMALWFLGEQMFPIEMVGTGMIVLGTVVTSCFGAHSEMQYNSSQMLDLFLHERMVFFYVVMFIILALSAATISVQNKPRWLEAFAFANIAGCLGGNQQIFLKGTMELVHQGQWTDPVTYLLIGITLVVAIMQLVFLNIGLSRHKAVTYLPVYQAALTVYGVVSGGIYFGEFFDYSTTSWILMPVGLVGIVAGLFLFAAAPRVDEVEDAKPKAVDTESQPLVPSSS